MARSIRLLHSVIYKFIGNLYAEAPQWDNLDRKTRELLVEGISINSGYNTKVIPPTLPNSQMTQVCKSKLLISNAKLEMIKIGNKTDCALIGFVLALGQSYEDIRKTFPEEKFVKVKLLWSFKLITVVIFLIFRSIHLTRFVSR